jgi:hypothetical protein
MKKIDLGQTITILANIGVILGIVFLAVELSQNNEELASQTRANIYQMRADLQTDYINNVGGIADIYTKLQSGEALSVTESNRLNSRRAHVLRTLEYMFHEDEAGTVAEAGFVEVMFRADPGLVDAWDRNRNDRNLEFVQFVEGRVIPRLDQ